MSSLEEKFAEIKNHLAVAETELQALKAGKKAASSRLRKSLMSVKTCSHGLRAETTSYLRSLPTKSRKPKADVVVEAE